MTIRSFAIFGAVFLFVTTLFQPTPAQAQIPLSGTVGQFLSQDLGLGAADAVSVGLNAGHLPAGLTLSLVGIQARISGTPTEAGTFPLTVAVTTSGSGVLVQNYSMTVGAPTITMTPSGSTLSNATVGMPYSQGFVVSGGTGPYLFTISGALPAGLTTSLVGGALAISGTPTAAGAFTLLVTARDSSTGTGAPFDGSHTYSLTVVAPVTLSPPTLPNPTVGQGYSQTLTASGGTGSFSYAVTAGALPSGLTLSSTGALSGTPTATGPFSFSVTATDSSNSIATNAYTVTVAAPTISLSPATLPPATVGVAYSQTFSASGGTGSYTYSFSGALPVPLTISAAGVLSGTPTAAGSFGLTVTATDAFGSTGSTTYTFSISAPAATSVALVSSSNPSHAGETVTFTATVTAGAGTPTGVVTFKDGAATLGTASLSGGHASFSTSALTTGTHTITAAYAGAAGFLGSTSAGLVQTVNVPLDSLKLRALQNTVTPVIAQSSGAAITSAIDGAISDAFSSSEVPVTASPNGVTFNFTDDPRSRDPIGAELQHAGTQDGNSGAYGPRANAFAGEAKPSRRFDDAFNALGYAGPVTKAPAPTPAREWRLWLDVHGTGWTVSDANADLKGSQVNVALGLTRMLTPDMLVGVIAGYENFNYDVASLTGNLKGGGETIGGYFARRFGALRFDAALGWSNLNYDASAGTASGSFTGSRWLASTGLTGTQRIGAFVLEPSAKIFMLWEREQAWTDSLGTLQDTRNFSAGRASGGMKLMQPFVLADDMKLAPYVGLYGDYNFMSDDAVPTGQPVLAIAQGWAARITTGASLTNVHGAMFGFGGELGGLGSNYKVWTGNIRAMLPF